MKNLIWLILPLFSLLACDKNNEVPVSEAEPWEVVFSEITEKILDSRVTGDELHLITDNFFYRIRGENILEKRPLSYDHYHNYSHPVLGQHLIFRLLNHDTVAYLEFQPIQPGGIVKKISYEELGNNKLTFPITHGWGGRHTGRFDDQGNFLFVGFEYPGLQQFARLVRIDFNIASNTIEDIQIDSILNLTPNLDISGVPHKAEDVFETDGVFFITCGNGGIYRYSDDDLDYFPNVFLYSVIKEETDYYSADKSRTIIKSHDMGITWTTTPWSLKNGRMLLKEGDFYIETTEANQLFRVGKTLPELIPFSFPPYKMVPFTFAEVKYYNGNYLLYGCIEGKNQIFKRSTMI